MLCEQHSPSIINPGIKPGAMTANHYVAHAADLGQHSRWQNCKVPSTNGHLTRPRRGFSQGLRAGAQRAPLHVRDLLTNPVRILLEAAIVQQHCRVFHTKGLDSRWLLRFQQAYQVR